MASYRIHRNGVVDSDTGFFSTLDEAKIHAVPYTVKERVVIMDNNSGHYERFDDEVGQWVSGTFPATDPFVG